MRELPRARTVAEDLFRSGPLKATDLDTRLLRTLEYIGEDRAEKLLLQIREATQRGEKIRNVGSFCNSVMKRLRFTQPPASFRTRAEELASAAVPGGGGGGGRPPSRGASEHSGGGGSNRGRSPPRERERERERERRREASPRRKLRPPPKLPRMRLSEREPRPSVVFVWDMDETLVVFQVRFLLLVLLACSLACS